MAWRAITEKDLTAKVSADELAQIRALAPEGTDPVGDSVAAITESVRGYVAANPRNVMGPEGMLPGRLIDAAVALIVPAIYSRTAGLLIDLNDTRIKAADLAVALLRDVARGLFAVELPASTPATEADNKSAAAELITQSDRPLRRDELAGL